MNLGRVISKVFSGLIVKKAKKDMTPAPPPETIKFMGRRKGGSCFTDRYVVKKRRRARRRALLAARTRKYQQRRGIYRKVA